MNYKFEIWKDIKGYEGKYQVSTFGRVKSLARKKWNGSGWQDINSIVKKIQVDLRGKGYCVTGLFKNKKNKEYKIHRLVAQSFIENPYGKITINHKDGNVKNNFVNNLEWCTHKENMEHANRTGLINNKGSRNGMSKLNEEIVAEIRKHFNGHNRKELAEKYNCTYDNIHSITHYDSWKL